MLYKKVTMSNKNTGDTIRFTSLISQLPTHFIIFES